MNDSMEDISRAPSRSAPGPALTANRKFRIARIVSSLLIVLAAISTTAGYQVRALKLWGGWFHTARAGVRLFRQPALVPASNPRANNTDMEAISHLGAQAGRAPSRTCYPPADQSLRLDPQESGFLARPSARHDRSSIRACGSGLRRSSRARSRPWK